MNMEPAQPDNTSPVHVAIIMDGNGRWARQRGLPRVAGHRQGAEAVQRVITRARERGIAHLTLFSFSAENWRRPEGEINDLMGLLRLYLKRELRRLKEQGIRFRVLGDPSPLPEDVQGLLADCAEETRNNVAMTLNLAINYGGREEIADAARAMARDAAAGRLEPGDVDRSVLEQYLYAPDLPDPDVVLRTSGEQRLSNFLLWQSAYAELVFVDTLWPDFTGDDLDNALTEFNRRERRFGARVG